jgi:hypothetical protein
MKEVSLDRHASGNFDAFPYRRPGLLTRAMSVGFLVDKITLGKIFLLVLTFFLST